MAKLTILKYPDPRLHKIARPVEFVNDSIRKLIDDMAETMYAAPGIGLAAAQVDQPIELIVLDVSEARNELKVFINPRLTRAEGKAKREEGCLSVPGIYDEIERAERITVEALDRDGKAFTLEAQGVLGVCIQHEMDHLKGKVFVEYLSALKQSRIRTKLKKQGRQAGPSSGLI
jgi:peptide deformylase